MTGNSRATKPRGATAKTLAGGLYGVNPFDQPGVEHGKKLAYGALGREGFEDLMGGRG